MYNAIITMNLLLINLLLILLMSKILYVHINIRILYQLILGHHFLMINMIHLNLYFFLYILDMVYVAILHTSLILFYFLLILFFI